MGLWPDLISSIATNAQQGTEEIYSVYFMTLDWMLNGNIIKLQVIFIV